MLCFIALRRARNLSRNVWSPVFLNFLYRSSLRLICLRMLWVIKGRENLPRIILVGIHLEVRVSSVVTKSDQSSSGQTIITSLSILSFFKDICFE